MQYKPVLDNIIVKFKNNLENKKGFVVITDKESNEPVKGEVIAVGPGIVTEKGREKPLIEEGSIILFDKQFGTEIEEIDGYTIICIKEKDILTEIIEG